MKTYQIYVDSAQSEVVSVSENSYKFDWNILPEGEYEMTFSFVSQLQKLTTAEGEANTYANQIEINIPFTANNYRIDKAQDGFAPSTHVSGLLEIKDQHTNSTHTYRLLVADTALNIPITLYGKPQGMTFNVRLLQHGGAGAAKTPSYNMVIFLKHIC
tara:strand:+ start:36 stop:509 length:474 start_codon:yes stop_codon:yes gene_type:complete